jgi:hypothetical protein
MSKHQRIIDYKKANPKAKAQEVAEAVGVAKSYLYTAFKNDRNKNVKTPKFKPPVMLPMPDVFLSHDHLKNLQREVKKLEHEAIGYRSVISYLEFQLGLKSTHNGTSVRG